MNSPFASQLRAAVILGMMGLTPALADADEFRLVSATLPAPLVDEAGSLYDRIIGADPADHRCDFWRR